MTDRQMESLLNQITHIKSRIHELFGDDDQRIELMIVDLIENCVGAIREIPSGQDADGKSATEKNDG